MLYRLFGFDLECAAALRRPRPAKAPRADPARRLELMVEQGGTHVPRGLPGEIVYESPRRTSDGSPTSVLERRADGSEVLRFPPHLAFHLHSGRLAAFSQEALDRAELRLLGPVLAYILERRGVPVLHAAVVGAGGRAFGFLAGHGGGKTCLAAASLAAGHTLLADDVLAAEPRGEGFVALSAYPWQRMTPAVARYFSAGEPADLELVHPESDKLWVPLPHHQAFTEKALPLAALFLPERRAAPRSSLELDALSPARATIELVRHSSTPYIVEAVGLQPRRLELLARLARTVPVYRLSFSDGFEHLPRVVGHILPPGP